MPLFQNESSQSLWYENEFHLHENELVMGNSFWYEWDSFWHRAKRQLKVALVGLIILLRFKYTCARTWAQMNLGKSDNYWIVLKSYYIQHVFLYWYNHIEDAGWKPHCCVKKMKGSFSCLGDRQDFRVWHFVCNLLFQPFETFFLFVWPYFYAALTMPCTNKSDLVLCVI